MPGFPQVCYLRNVITRPNIVVGDYTYYDDPDGPERFERNVLYHYPFLGDKLVIGKFCAIGRDVKFIMNGANHRLDGFSTYPFSIFASGWEKVMPTLEQLALRGDTTVGNDVWLGYDSMILPGVTIGDGAIVATRAVVTKPVPDYAIVAGNPARVVRMRFDPSTVQRLKAIAWWDWDAAKITRHLEKIIGQDLAALEAAD